MLQSELCSAFLPSKIQVLRQEIYQEGRQYFRKHRLLDVHRQVHRNSLGHEMITLVGIDVYHVSWHTIMGVSMAMYYRWKGNAGEEMCAEHHGSLGTKKPRTHTLQATAILRLMLE
jgi:hypothetical protein